MLFLFSFVIVTLTIHLQRDIFDHCIVTHVRFKPLAFLVVKLKIVCPPTSCLENLWFCNANYGNGWIKVTQADFNYIKTFYVLRFKPGMFVAEFKRR